MESIMRDGVQKRVEIYDGCVRSDSSVYKDHDQEDDRRI